VQQNAYVAIPVFGLPWQATVYRVAVGVKIGSWRAVRAGLQHEDIAI
jgi:hypothetical protein